MTTNNCIPFSIYCCNNSSKFSFTIKKENDRLLFQNYDVCFNFSSYDSKLSICYLLKSARSKFRNESYSTTPQRDNATTRQRDNATTRQRDNATTRQRDNATTRQRDNATTRQRCVTATAQQRDDCTNLLSSKSSNTLFISRQPLLKFIAWSALMLNQLPSFATFN